jgi:tRNA dimethylallyltransferase
VASLFERGYTRFMPGMKSIGYQECIEYLNGRISIDEARALIKQNTRNYAKRQLTYFKRFKYKNWFEKDDISINDSKIYEAVIADISKNI